MLEFEASQLDDLIAFDMSIDVDIDIDDNDNDMITYIDDDYQDYLSSISSPTSPISSVSPVSPTSSTSPSSIEMILTRSMYDKILKNRTCPIGRFLRDMNITYRGMLSLIL